jgi:predicted acylesterase/phospholipase RssA
MGTSNERDTALVLSGGSINGALMEAGFLRRLGESALWPRVGWIFGTSAGALTGTLATLGRFDELDEFLLALDPADCFRPNRLWRLPLVGSHEYSLPATVAERLGDPAALAASIAAADIELVVCATDLTAGHESEEPGPHEFELVYSSKTTPPEEFAEAILASSAISGIVPPTRVGRRIATDGGWTRNFPLGHAYERPEVQRIVSFRYLPTYPPVGIDGLVRLRRRLERFSRIPPVRALVEELRDAEQRHERGEPPHAVATLVRLMRVAVVQNTELEERRAAARDDSIRALAQLRYEIAGLVATNVRSRRDRERLAAAVDERFAGARFPFRADRLVPRITVSGTAGALSLEAGKRGGNEWPVADKRALIELGYELTDRELEENGFGRELSGAA